MKTTILPAAIAAMLSLFFSCGQDGPVEPEIPAELDNAIEYNGRITALGSRFVDPDDGMIHLVAQEGVTSAAELQDLDCGYVSIDTGADSWLGADVVEIDLTSLPSGFSLTYIDDGAVIVNVSAANPGAVVSGGLTFRADAGAESVSLSGTLDFSVTLADGNVLRGNALLPEVREDEGGESAYPEEPMTFTVDGVSSPVGTAAVENYDGYVMFTVTPQPDAGLFSDIYDAGYDYIQLLLLPGYLNEELDVLDSPAVIYGWRSSDGTVLSITPDGGRGLLESGTVRIDFDGASGDYTLYMHLDFAAGPEVGVHAVGQMTGEAPEEGSTISINGDVKPVRASFYIVEDGTVMLSFTSAEVYYFDEMVENAVRWFSVSVDESLLGAGDIDISSEDSYFMLCLMDNMTGEFLMAESGMPDGASGVLNVSRDASDPEHFTVSVSVAFGNGTTVVVDFDGPCVSADYVPEEPNELTYMGVTETIESVLVDKTGGALWEIWVSTESGLDTVADFECAGSVHITVPEAAFNYGDAVGFSTFKDTMKFEYDGKTWQYDGGNTLGSLEVSLDGDQIALDFTTYGDLSGHYEGTAVIVG